MIDVEANRASRKWSRREQIGRALWAFAGPLFVLSPKPLWGWRAALLRLFGARIGKDVRLSPSVRVWIPWKLTIEDCAAVGDRAILYNLGPLHIGRSATISHGAHLCGGTHDFRDPAMPLVKLPIRIGPGAWICADAFIGPGVTVGRSAIVGARATVVRDVGSNQIVAGNPARVIGIREPTNSPDRRSREPSSLDR